MARKTQAEVIDDLKDRHSDLEDQVEELQEENESLQGRLDAAADAIAGEEEAEGESDLEEADDDADADDLDELGGKPDCSGVYASGRLSLRHLGKVSRGKPR